MALVKVLVRETYDWNLDCTSGGFDWFPEDVTPEELSQAFADQIEIWADDMVHIYLCEIEVPDGLEPVEVTNWIDDNIWEMEYRDLMIEREYRSTPEVGIR